MSDYLKSVLNAFHDLLFVFTEDGIITDYLTTNHQDELITPKEVFLGKHHSKVLPPHVSKKIEQAFNEIDRGKEQYKFDYELEVQGESQWYVAVFSKIETDGDSRYLGAVRNITVRKNQELLLRGILNTAPGGIMVFRAVKDSDQTVTDFEITHVNRTVEELTGATEQKLLGQNLEILIPDSVKETVLDQFKTVMKTGEPANFEYRFVNESGESVWYLNRAAKFKEGIVSSFLDISDQKVTEQELVKTNEELTELNRQKDKLFSVIAHDLKNAVSGTLGIYELIFEEIEDLTEEELYNYLEILNRGARNATELLNDLLLWSKNQFEEVNINPEPFNLFDIAQSVLENLSANAEEKRIEMKNEIPTAIQANADVNMFKIILRNLISNGIKFSHPAGEIVVSAESKQDALEVSVSDEGVGIEEEEIIKILNKKNNYTTRGTKGEKGSGLGLDLCLDFVEKHGGEIWIESEPGNGSTFTFSLPGNS